MTAYALACLTCAVFLASAAALHHFTYTPPRFNQRTFGTGANR